METHLPTNLGIAFKVYPELTVNVENLTLDQLTILWNKTSVYIQTTIDDDNRNLN